MKSGNNPAFNMMGAGSPKKFNEKLEKAVDDGKIKGEFAAAVKSGMPMKAPMDMKAPMELEMEKDSAMQLKSAMDMAKDGPMNLMDESPKKMTPDAAMKMAAAMKKFYNS